MTYIDERLYLVKLTKSLLVIVIECVNYGLFDESLIRHSFATCFLIHIENVLRYSILPHISK